MHKRTYLVVIAAVCITATVVAAAFARGGRYGLGWQHGPGMSGHRFERMMEQMVDNLGLGATQREHVFAVLDDARPSLRNLRFAFRDHRRAFMQLDPTSADYADRLVALADETGKLASQAVTLIGETRAKVAALLTEEQREQVRKLLNEHREQRFGKTR